MAFYPAALERVQFAKEVTPGTVIATTHQFKNLQLDVNPKIPVTEVNASGVLFATDHAVGKGHTEVSFKSEAVNVQDAIIIMSTALEAPTFALAGTSMYTATFDPDGVSVPTVNTLSIEKGLSTASSAYKFGFAQCQSFEMDFVPDKTVGFSGKLIGQGITTGVSLTATPTVLGSATLNGATVDVYLATTEAGLGAGQVKPLSCKLKMDKLVGDVYVLSSAAADASFTELIITKPNLTYELEFPRAAATNTFLTAISNATLYYIEIIAKGGLVETVSAVAHQNQITLRSPVKFMTPDFGAAQDVSTFKMVANAIHDPTFNSAAGGAIKVIAKSALASF